MCSGCGCYGLCGVCKAVQIVLLLLVSVLALAAVMGLYLVHVTPGGLVFGTTEGSLSILALLACLVGWKKMYKGLCTCSHKHCGHDGKCSDCGNDPCTCGK